MMQRNISASDNFYPPKIRKDAWEGLKDSSESTNEKNSPCKTNILIIKHIVRGVLKSKKLPLIIILMFVDIPNIKRIVGDLLNPKKFSLMVVTFVGIYILRNFIIGQDHNSGKNSIKFTITRYYREQDQKTDKNKPCENKLQNSDKKPDSFLEELKTRLPKTPEYDPSIDYEELAWKTYCKTHKGAEESMKKIEEMIESYNDTIIENTKNEE
ncbi:hypothetical protein C1645_878308 [Glomus cerebriforme]|uniref:Uncharacterized protein n=1 Tax=Glomus cerebriforme TaxID=658196 RepID=A0A397SLF8_9GLOM|nr:hypothetical protein C1645_878308 [Glomus cerebriforme]